MRPTSSALIVVPPILEARLPLQPNRYLKRLYLLRPRSRPLKNRPVLLTYLRDLSHRRRLKLSLYQHALMQPRRRRLVSGRSSSALRGSPLKESMAGGNQ